MQQKLKEIGQRISNKRKALGLTQEQLAEKMDVSIQMISNLERGNKAIKIENLIKLSDILQVSTDYILLGKYVSADNEQLFKKINALNPREYKIVTELIDYCTENNQNI